MWKNLNRGVLHHWRTREASAKRDHTISFFDKIRLPVLKLTIYTRLKGRQKYSMCSTSGIFPLLHLIPFYFRIQCMCEYRQTLGLMSIRSGLWPSGDWANVRKAVLRWTLSSRYSYRGQYSSRHHPTTPRTVSATLMDSGIISACFRSPLSSNIAMTPGMRRNLLTHFNQQCQWDKHWFSKMWTAVRHVCLSLCVCVCVCALITSSFHWHSRKMTAN